MKVTVIGAGLVGLSTAVTLQEAGHDVLVVDPDPGSGATHHAGGMLAPAAEMVYQQEALFPLMQASKQLYPHLLSRVSAGLPTGFRSEGTLLVAADRADGQHLRELVELQRSHGMEAEVITTGQARAIEPGLSPRLSAAAHVPGDHQVNPRLFAASLTEQLGSVLIRERALRIEGHTVVTESRQIPSDQVVIANGLGAAALAEPLGMRLPLRPVYGDMVRVHMPDGVALFNRVVRGFVEDRPIYAIPRSDGTVAIGATSREDGRDTPLAGSVHRLLRDATRILPGLEECDFLEATAGARPGTPDDLPLLGRVNEHVVVSTGFFRHGILLSAAAAQVVCELVDSQPASVDISACAPDRFSIDEGES